ncbi:hypothetical protein B0J18DRAFT_469770 [Chaetomium sp. MPI-SDFR-AT-0129]|nr:hypothetical protein B0J18DRAFT_469770 [Chaetomium sp. MPI-SDFR-AT-0129]
MTSTNTAHPASQPSLASSENGSWVNMIELQSPSIESILDRIIESRLTPNHGSIFQFSWPEDYVGNLVYLVKGRLRAYRHQKLLASVDFDYDSSTLYIDCRTNTAFCDEIILGLLRHICSEIETPDRTPDSVIQKTDVPRQYIERKARRYIQDSEGTIEAVLVLDVRYPDMKKAWVSLYTKDRWIRYREVVCDDTVDEQPVGQVDFYLSDLAGPVGLPPSYCRPSVAETAAGVTREPVISLAFAQLRDIVRVARLDDEARRPVPGTL